MDCRWRPNPANGATPSLSHTTTTTGTFHFLPLLSFCPLLPTPTRSSSSLPSAPFKTQQRGFNIHSLLNVVLSLPHRRGSSKGSTRLLASSPRRLVLGLSTAEERLQDIIIILTTRAAHHRLISSGAYSKQGARAAYIDNSVIDFHS